MTTNADQDEVLWGARAIGRVVNRNQRQTFELLEKRVLPGKKIGKLWVATRSQLLAALQQGAAPDADAA
jgi:hypothetical protein